MESILHEFLQLQSTLFKSNRKYNTTVTLLNTKIDTMNLKLATLKAENSNTISGISKK